MRSIQFGQSLINVLCKDDGVIGRVPYMRFHATGMIMVAMLMSCCMNQVDTFRSVKELQLWRVGSQSVHPSLFKSDVPDTEICLTLVEGNQLLRSRIVCFRTASFGNHAHYLILVACDSFGEISQRLQGYGYCWLLLGLGRRFAGR